MRPRHPFLLPAVGAALVYLAALAVLAVANPVQVEPVVPLRVEAATPLLGTCGQDLALTLTGRGFDEQTRVSLALDVVNGDARLATMATYANLHDVVVADGRAYLANSYRGFQVADFRDLLKPRIVGSLATSRAWAVDVQGATAYLADAKEGLLVIDVADAAAPRLLAATKVPGVALEVAARGDTVYLCAGPGGLLTFDAAAPGEPRIASSLTESPVWDVALAEDLVLLATSLGVQVLTLDDPHRPRPVGRLATAGRVYAVAVTGRWGFFIDAERRFGVIDCSDPHNPVLAGMTPVPVAASKITVAGDRAYLTAAGGVLVVAIDDPRQPRILGQVADVGVMQMAVDGDLGFAAGSSSGLQVLDLQRLQPLQAIASVGSVGNIRSLARDGETVCLSDGSAEVRIIDLSEPTAPRLASVFAAAGEVAQVVMADGRAYLAAGAAGLQVVDVRDPCRPRPVGVLRTPGVVSGVAVEGEEALVLDVLPAGPGNDDGERVRSVRVVDVADPAVPRVTGAWSVPSWVRRAEIVDGRGYLAAGKDGLLILDLADPEHPALIGTVKLPWPQQAFARARDVAVRRATAYLANGPAGLQVIDLGDGRRPQVIGNLDVAGYAKGVAIDVERDLVYLHNRHRLQVVDVRDPRTPVLVGELQLPREAEQALVEDDRVLVAGGRNGLLVLPLPLAGEVVDAGPDRLEVTLPGPELPGRYRLTVYGRGGSAQLSEPIVFTP